MSCGSGSSSSEGGSPIPAITSLSPSSIGAGGAGFTLTVNGRGFVSASAVEWNGSARSTSFISGSQLQAQINASDVVSGGTAQITVITPSPGGGTSPQAAFTIVSNAGLTITSISPSSALAGSQLESLIVNGIGFVSGSEVQFAGSPRYTTFVSNSQLLATLYGDDTLNAGPVLITVMNPIPNGITSPAVEFSVTNPVPTITSIGNTTAQAGSAGFRLLVLGSDFVPTSVVQWNGTPLATTYYGSIQLFGQVTASELATAGAAAVTVVNPAPGGGTSSPATFTVIAAGQYTVDTLNQAANDLVWDPVNQVIYLSVPSTASANGNTISVQNPATGTIVSTQFAGSEPDVLALSASSTYLYAGLDGSASVQRFKLPDLGADVSYSLGNNGSGPYFALDLQAAPSNSHTSAVTLGSTGSSPEALGGVVIYDDATPRPTMAPGFGTYGGSLYDSLQWGSDDSVLYANNNEDSAFDFFVLDVNSQGVTPRQDYPNAFTKYYIRIHYDLGTQLVYGDDGSVVTPSTGLPAGVFQASGVMVPDSSLNAAFFAGQTNFQSGTGDITIESFNLTQFTPVAEISIPNVNGNPVRLIRWGQNGLAFNTDAGQVYILSGPFVGQVSRNQPRRETSLDLSPVQRTWAPPKRR
jgi:hypothetical protein